MAEINKLTKGKIFANYFGGHCEICENNVWSKRRVDGDVLKKVLEGVDARLLLKNRHLITVEEAFFAIALISKLKGDDNDLFDPNYEYSETEKMEMRRQLLDNDDCDLPYPVVDYLRRQGYHMPIYGLNLFRAKLAKPYDK